MPTKPFNEDGAIYILTVYTPQEALYYFMHEWEENPDTATVIKRIKYDKPPVVKMEPAQWEGIIGDV